MRFLGLNHIQLHVPADRVQEAHAFYCLALSFQDLQLPQGLGGSGGFWMAVPECSIWVGPIDTPVSSKIVSIVTRPLPTAIGFERLEFTDPFGHVWQLVCRLPYDV